MGNARLLDETSVVRFPVELLALHVPWPDPLLAFSTPDDAPAALALRGVEPGVREVMQAADSLGLALPPVDLFERVDEETARYIAEQVLPLAPHERRGALDALLRPVAGAAAEACRQARDAAQWSATAQAELERARAVSGAWLGPLEAAAEARLQVAAALLIAAHERCRASRGVARAVGLARRGEAWTPYRAAGTTGLPEAIRT